MEIGILSSSMQRQLKGRGIIGLKAYGVQMGNGMRRKERLRRSLLITSKTSLVQSSQVTMKSRWKPWMFGLHQK